MFAHRSYEAAFCQPRVQHDHEFFKNTHHIFYARISFDRILQTFLLVSALLLVLLSFEFFFHYWNIRFGVLALFFIAISLILPFGPFIENSSTCVIYFSRVIICFKRLQSVRQL